MFFFTKLMHARMEMDFGDFASLDALRPSSGDYRIFVKVDGAYLRTDFDVYDRDMGCPKRVLSVDSNVFDPAVNCFAIFF